MTPPPTAASSIRYARTASGRAEIQQKALSLSRPARNLLLVIDASRSGADWLALVQGAGPAELRILLDAGLLAVADPGPATAAARGAGVDAATGPSPPGRPTGEERIAPHEGPPVSLTQALQTKSFQVLYTRITHQARPRLGLLGGYRLVLELERCQSADAVRALAQRFVAQVRGADGDAAALALAQLLLAPD